MELRFCALCISGSASACLTCIYRQQIDCVIGVHLWLCHYKMASTMDMS